MRNIFTMILVILTLFTVLVGGFYIERYWNWRSLSKDELVESAISYTEANHIDDVGICFYRIDCSGTRARLHRVAEINQWDLDQTLDQIWERRFNDYCEGRSINIGLNLVSTNEENETLDQYNQIARWSFKEDRFISAKSFPILTFSDEPWERCAEPYFIAAVSNE